MRQVKVMVAERGTGMALVVKATERQAHRLLAVAEAEGTAGTRAATAIGQ
jgi:hypothetical protein